METSWRFHGERRRAYASGWERPLVGVDAAATDAILRLHLGAVTDRALAVGLAGLLDRQVHGGAGSRLKGAGEQVGCGEANNSLIFSLS